MKGVVKMKNVKKFLFLFTLFMLLLVFDCGAVKAVNYTYESGVVEKKYQDVVVNSFSYDYITTFKGESVFDNGVNVNEEKFYSGKSIKLNVEQVSYFWPWKDDDDITYIYKYNSTRNDFDSTITSFPNRSGSYEFTTEGLYKVEYVFEGDKKFVTYIYICQSIHEAKVEGDKKYSNISAYSEFSFNLKLKDGYDLRTNKYYYAFGTNPSSLSFRKLDVFSDVEKAGNPIMSIDKNLVVDILDNDVSLNGQKKFLFVKIELEDSENLIQTEKSYELSNKIQARVYMVDNNDTVIAVHKSYKRNEIIRFKVVLNASVTYSNLQFGVDGFKYFSIPDSLNEVNEIELEYYVDDYVGFAGSFELFTKSNTNAVVRYKGTNVALNVIEKCSFDVDVSSPVIDVLDSGDIRGKKSYKVTISVNEENLKEVMYYAERCTISQADSCLMNFNDANPNVVSLGVVNSTTIEIDKSFGDYNGENLALFIKAIDNAGNVSSYVKWGYVIDNVIVPSDERDEIFDYDDVKTGEIVVGKKLIIRVPIEYNISSVSYSLGNALREACSSDLVEHSGKYVYECLKIENYDFNSEVLVSLVDSFGNVEEYSTNFRFSMIKEDVVIVNEKVFNLIEDEEYEIEFKMYNYLKKDQQLIFEENVFEMFEEKLNLDKIPSISDLKINLVYFSKDDIVVLNENINGEFNVPSVWDLMEMLDDIDIFKMCYKDKCDVDIYLEYEYRAIGVLQKRFIKINYLDNSNKYLVENFAADNIVDVGEIFNDFNYTYLNNINKVINKENVVIIKKVIFEDVGGNKKEVDVIDTSLLGRYIVKEYFEYDSVYSFPLEYVVNVVDSKAPIIRLNGEEKIKIRVGDSFKDHFVTIRDNYDQDLQVKISYDPLFDLNKPGTYIISYWCEDSSGNVSETITRTIVVKEKVGKVVYLVSGGIALFTVLLMACLTLVEVKKERRRR